jgi:hypothetical protein
MPERKTWRRAGRCSANGCLEVAHDGDGIAIRDSHRPDHVLVVPAAEFLAFLQGVRDGEFDDLVS